jgi:hypothetical protein
MSSNTVDILKKLSEENEIHGSFRRSKLLNGLTLRQILFVEFFIKNGGHGAAAVKEAGYRNNCPKSYAEKLLSKPEVNQAIMLRIRKNLCSNGLSADSVIQELIAVAFSNIKSLITWKDGGDTLTLIDSEKVDEVHAKAVRQLCQKILPGGHKSLTLKFYDKLKALDMLARCLGLFDQQANRFRDVSDTEDLTDEELIRKYESELVRQFPRFPLTQLEPSS